MNEAFTEVLNASDLPVGRIRAVKIDDRTVAVCHTANGFFATDNTCPHRGGPLSEGDLLGEEIVCPWHLWGFDVRTGLCPGNAEYTIATHEVKIDGDRILVKLSPVRETSGAL
ncbi:MAG: nitrite reductase small subunit [Thermoanaerobaculia bacterium]|jgi:nitrite reductase/ring-hydroxylating ferredoxin subunit|nr:nitrite reductase small subunit [Thermoanaerobaculia bacterium]